MNRTVAAVVALLAAALLGWYALTPYKYISHERLGLVRVARMTGEAEVLSPAGWGAVPPGTEYVYTTAGSFVYRVHIVSGAAYMLTPTGWGQFGKDH